MLFCRDPLGIRLGRRLRPLLGVALLLGSQAVSVSLAASIPFFSGISSIEARPGKAANVQVLEFQADQPFEYKMSVIDADHVALKLYNAQLANNLLTPEGGINLMPGGAVQGASLRLPDREHLFSSDYQEIILTGKNLGRKKLQILGANLQADTEMPQSASTFMKTDIVGLPSAASSRQTASKPTVNLPEVSQSLTTTRDGLQGNVTQRTQSTGSTQGASNSVSPSPAIVSNPSVSSRGPQIESVQTLPGRLGSNPPSLRLTPTMAGVNQALPSVELAAEHQQTAPDYPTPPQNVPWQEQSSDNSDAAASDDDMHTLMPALPHYRGGAKPIAAMTTDRKGNPVYLTPKAQPLPEFSIGKPAEGYATLYQAESTSPANPAQVVSQRMAAALEAFRDGRYPQAQQSVESALSVDPDNANLYAALAEIQLKRQQLEASRNAYQRAVELAPGQYRQRYVQVLVLSGDRQSAIDVLAQQYKENPRQAQIAYMLGTLHEELGQSVSALPYLEQAAILQPKSADVQYNLGLAYELTGARTQARQHYQTALKLNPKALDIAKALQRIQR